MSGFQFSDSRTFLFGWNTLNFAFLASTSWIELITWVLIAGTNDIRISMPIIKRSDYIITLWTLRNGHRWCGCVAFVFSTSYKICWNILNFGWFGAGYFILKSSKNWVFDLPKLVSARAESKMAWLIFIFVSVGAPSSPKFGYWINPFLVLLSIPNQLE